jgi:AraC family transcriptional regulator
MLARQPDLPPKLPADRAAESRTMRVPGFTFRLGVHSAGSELPPHEHGEPTICYVLRGGFTEYSGGEAADCGPATLKLMPAGEQHWNRFGELETQGLRIDVERDRFGDAPDVLRALDERHRGAGSRAAVLARRLAFELTADDAATSIAAEALALELVVELARARQARRASPTPHWLLAAEDLIRARYRSHITVSEIAREVEVHPATLSRGYRRRFRCTIGEQIRRLRIEHAARELVETSDPLSEIALRAGFYDQSHFTNLFRRVVGVTPAAYRSQAVPSP